MSNVWEQKRIGDAIRRGSRAVKQQKPPHRPIPYKLTGELAVRLINRRRAGATYVQLADEFGISSNSVWKILKDVGMVDMDRAVAGERQRP